MAVQLTNKNKAEEVLRMDYQYPIDFTWKTDEIVQVISFFQGIEKAYEKGIYREELMALYKDFKRIVPSIAEEKKVCGEFEEVSGYSSYRAMQKAKKCADGELVKM